MKTLRLTIKSAFSAGLAAIAVIAFSPTLVAAQSGPVGLNPPPSVETKSPGDVDLPSGAFSMRVTDLAIGDGSFPGGLSLVRTYNSGTGSAYTAFTTGWAHNWFMQITGAPSPTPDGITFCEDVPELFRTDLCSQYYFVLSWAGGSAKYSNTLSCVLPGGLSPSHTAANTNGIYVSYDEDHYGRELKFVGADGDGCSSHYWGHYEFTDSDGTLYVFNPLNAAEGQQKLSHVIAPNGVRADVHYQSGRVIAVTTSDGYALLFEYGALPLYNILGITKACVVNLATTQVSPGSICPAGGTSVSYQYGTAEIAWLRGDGVNLGSTFDNTLTSVTDAAGGTTTYGYDDGGHVDCITDPGTSVCRVKLTYATCFQRTSYYPEAPGARYPELHLSEVVLRQDFANGEFLTYGSMGSYECPNEGEPVAGSFTDALGNATAVALNSGKPASITDPLGRVTTNSYPGQTSIIGGPGLVRSTTYPEGNRSEFTYDNRANLIQVRSAPKNGSVDLLLTHSAVYPFNCANRKTCNQPTSITDAKGNVTTYTYDPAHGGVLTMTAPAVGGMSPMTRYYFVQREAWVRSGAGYVKTGKPMWLKSEERSCRTSALDPVAGTCSAGAGDLVRTLYDYGPDSGPNNLWVRGMAVVADGQTLRTCYQYDPLGRRIAETKPLGTGATCP